MITFFISYSHLDAAIARRLAADLENHGVRVWLERQALDSVALIGREILQARVVMPLLVRDRALVGRRHFLRGPPAASGRRDCHGRLAR